MQNLPPANSTLIRFSKTQPEGQHVQNESGYFRTAIRRTTMAAPVLLVSTPDGKADLSMATAAGASRATGVLVQLIVQASKKTFTISGNLDTPIIQGPRFR